MRGPFDPVVGRQTSVVLTRNVDTGDHRLVTSISTRKTTEVLRINLRTGRLELENDAVAESTYEDENEALSQLGERGHELVERGYALLGYAVAGATAGVLLATRVREKAVLPGGHAVYLITDSQWVLVPLQNEAADAAAAAVLAGLPPPRGDADFWRTVQQYTLNNAHYYCETADMSRPFPSACPVEEPNPEFVWNSWLRQPLLEMGLFQHTPVMLQGAVECSLQAHPDGTRFSMALVSRRSRRHPGTRYLARGLNALAGPGNEIECELVLWLHPGWVAGGGMPRQALRWARCVWRRGTVPIWWGVQLQSLQKGLAAEVYVREEAPYRGTATYFRTLQRQHAPYAPAASSGVAPKQHQQGSTTGGSGEDASSSHAGRSASAGAGALLPVTCINLLHVNPKKASELMLSSHFQESMRHVRGRLGGGAPVRVLNFDWHGTMGQLGEERAVEAFWAFCGQLVQQSGLALGSMELADAPITHMPAAAAAAAVDTSAAAAAAAGEANASSSSASAASPAACVALTPWPPGWRMRWVRQQEGLLRFNCADSLDRTNAATCFAMLPVLQEGMRLLGLQLDCGDAQVVLLRGMPSPGAGSSSSSAQDLAAIAARRAETEGGSGSTSSSGREGPAADQDLPPGWEVRMHEGRSLYIDHLNKRTQWTSPALLPSGGGSRGPSGSNGGGTFMQSAAGMLARLQRQSSPTRSPTRASPQQQQQQQQQRPSGSGRSSPALEGLQRQSSPPRMPGGRHAGGSSFGSSSDLQHLSAAAAPGTSHATYSPSLPTTAPLPLPGGMHKVDPSAPWAFFGYGLQEVRERLLREAVADFVDMFRVHGDIHSFLYTGSPAMHSHVLGLVVQGGKAYGAASGVGKLQNLRVAVQRRWNNTVSDTSRQQAMELFLGLRNPEADGERLAHFPALSTPYPDTTTPLLAGLDAAEEQEGHAGVRGAAAAAAAAAVVGEQVAAAAVGQQPWPVAAGDAAEPLSDAGAAAGVRGSSPDEEQQQEAGEGAAAALLAGLPLHSHDGVVGVPADLLDLEPLEPVPEPSIAPAAAQYGSDTATAQPAADPLGAGEVGSQLCDLLL